MVPTVTQESVYEEILEKGPDGKALRARSKKPFLKELLREGKIKKIRSKYYVTEHAPTTQKVFEKIKEAERDGVSLNIAERQLIKPLVDEQKVRVAYRKYYLSRYAPLTQREVVQRLLNEEYVQKMRSKYVFIRNLGEDIEPKEEKRLPSFFEFLETLQEIYLRKGKRYQESVRILPLLEELTFEMNISRELGEKWILELPKIFIGVVGLRLFADEPGLEIDDGGKISRIYLEREIVGL